MVENKKEHKVLFVKTGRKIIINYGRKYDIPQEEIVAGWENVKKTLLAATEKKRYE